MKQAKKEAVTDRRSFLKLAGASAAAGGAAAIDGRDVRASRRGEAQTVALPRD